MTIGIGETTFTFLGPVTRTRKGYVLQHQGRERQLNPQDANALANGSVMGLDDLRKHTKPLPRKCKRTVRTVEAEEARRIIKSSKKPVMVAFVANWCGACQETKPEIRQAARHVCDKAEVLMVDVDKNEALSSKHKVEALPTAIVFKNGRAVKRIEGGSEAHDYAEAVQPPPKKA